MVHDEGPFCKVEWVSKSKKSMIAAKVSEQDIKMIKRETFIKAMSYKKTYIKMKAQTNVSQIF